MYRMIKRKAERVECPKCDLVAYKISSELNSECPNCGFAFREKIQRKKSFERLSKGLYNHGIC